MTPEQYERTKQVFLAACVLHESDRPVFLDQACAGDPALRREVESLLKYHDPATLIGPAPQQGQRIEVQQTPEPPGQTPTDEIDVPTSRPSEQADQGRFAPGTIIADRYRIERLLGKGGMGEVYCAKDLKLGQTVALKFIVPAWANDPQWLERLCEEVRLARRVTHPNVCRVFDIGQAGEDAFLSMEYVDGEDLGTLLRRVGRLSADKTVQIARQICAGLGAAHDNGILHRDLKPANIMIDGDGRVRITDFGIAAAIPRQGQQMLVAGSPSYIAPEILQGAPPSPRSDIYSLGLVLYEAVTGRQVLAAGSFADRLKEHALPPAPSSLARDIDPALERVILQCIEEDPQLRPASMYAVAAALPGTDPLAALMAEGQTPAPGFLIVSRGTGLQARVALGAALWTVLGLIAVLLLAGRTLLLSTVGLARPPAVLADKAQEVLRTLSGTTHARGIPRGFRLYRAPLTTAAADLPGPPAPQVFFEYWQGTLFSPGRGPLAVPNPFDLAMPGEAARIVRLDPAGNLLLYVALPQASASSLPGPAPVDWPLTFRLAGLDIGNFQPLAARQRPPVFADTSLAWAAVQDRGAAVANLVEAAALEGHVVYFRVGQMPMATRPPAADAAFVARSLVFLLLLAGALMLAWRNVRIGRGDRLGAWRLAAVVFAIQAVLWAIRRSYATNAAAELPELIASLRFATFAAAVAWVFYIAIEPQMRRFWPHAIISWTKVLAGRFVDPIVGRDVLLGSAAGVSLVLLQQAGVLLEPRILPSAAQWVLPPDDDLRLVTGLRYMLDITADASRQAIWGGLGLLLLMLLLRVGLRRSARAVIAFVAIATTFFVLAYPSMGGSWLTSGLISVGMAAILTRLGLLAGMTTLFCDALIRSGIPSADRHAWCADVTGFTLVVLAGLVGFGLYVSLWCGMNTVRQE